MSKLRRDLSGIYIFEERDGERTPVCIEECRSDARTAWMETKSKEYLMGAVDRLCEVINEIGEMCNIKRG